MKSRWSVILLCALLMVFALLRLAGDRSSAESVYADEFIQMELIPVESSATTMQETVFEVRISELSGTPVMDADPELQITMPSMFCGVFPAVIEESEPGVYLATVVPAMRGQWEAEAWLYREDRIIQVSTSFAVR